MTKAEIIKTGLELGVDYALTSSCYDPGPNGEPCGRYIAQQISHVFGVNLDKDVVRRVLAKHYRPAPGADGPSWLSFIAQCKDSVWSVDLFRCESVLLKSHWVMVVMDLFTRRFVGFGLARAPIDGLSVCRMFNHATYSRTWGCGASFRRSPL
jgi:putative transposase